MMHVRSKMASRLLMAVALILAVALLVGIRGHELVGNAGEALPG